MKGLRLACFLSVFSSLYEPISHFLNHDNIMPYQKFVNGKGSG